MSSITAGKAMAAFLIQEMGLPELTHSVSFRLSADRLPELEVLAYVSEIQEKQLMTKLKAFELVPRWDLIAFCQTGNGYR